MPIQTEREVSPLAVLAAPCSEGEPLPKSRTRPLLYLTAYRARRGADPPLPRPWQGENAIHRVSNPFEERAVSLHVYSRPYDTCIAYDPPSRTARVMKLCYHSIGGKLVDDPPEQLQ